MNRNTRSIISLFLYPVAFYCVTLVSVLLLAILLVRTDPGFAGTQPELHLYATSCKPGQTASVYVSLDNPESTIDALVLSVDVDDRLTIVDYVSYLDQAIVSIDTLDTDGEFDYAAWVFGDAPLPSGTITEISVLCGDAGEYAIAFSLDPYPSAGANGDSVFLKLSTSSIAIESTQRVTEFIFLPEIMAGR